MQRMPRRRFTYFGAALLTLSLLWSQGIGLATDAPTVKTSTDEQLWRISLERVEKGDFHGAIQKLQKVHSDSALTANIRSWLDEHEEKQKKREELNRIDYEKYVRYAKTRIERKEYKEALYWVLASYDVAADKESLLHSQWLQDLVNEALVLAVEYREKSEWRDAWNIYYYLDSLYESEPRYKKLEHEVLTLLRLDNMFENDKWQERIERVQWRDAKKALEYIDKYYVVKADFKRIAESGLEQLLLLADSKSAQEKFEHLKDADNRTDFKIRIKARLDRVQEAATLSRSECISHFRRAVKSINPETIRLPDELVISEFMNGALEPLDDFTAMIWPRATKDFEKHTRGEFIGVGISIRKNRLGEILVVTPLEDTPAYRAGIQSGDIIIKVDGKSLKDFSINKVVDTITGPRDTAVTLTIRRDNKEIDFPLHRTKVKIQSVKGWVRNPDESWNHWLDKENGIAYLRVTNFQKNTPEDLANAMSELQAENLNGLIVDLRSNPGGLLDAAWQISSMFLKGGDPVVSTKGRIRYDDQSLHAPGDGPYSDIPLVVLVDQNSASASEIVSGAIRDNHRGIVIGERTFGKFSVQNLIPLHSAKLKITTARYYIPSGASLHREPNSKTWGVEPDIRVPLVNKERSKVRIMRRNADLIGPPVATKKSDDQAKNDKEEEDKPKNEKGDEDNEIAGEKVADAEDSKDKLPPPDEPDENNRPEEDFQVDVALLLLRIKVLGNQFSTLAAAESDYEKKIAHP